MGNSKNSSDFRRSFAKRTRGERPIVLGHRGARHAAPENTLEAFELALNEGADGVELDVRMTADLELVIHHDPSVKIPSGRRAIALSTYAELEACGCRLPTLDEVLDWQANTGALLNVEIKGDLPSPLTLAEKASSRLRGAQGVVVSSFSAEILAFFARYAPTVPLGLLLEPGDLGRIRLPKFDLAAIHPHHSDLTPAAMERLARSERIVATWTVNDPLRARDLASLGVDVLISDCPAKILAALGGRRHRAAQSEQ